MLLRTLPVTRNVLLPKVLRSGSPLSKMVRKHSTKCLQCSSCLPDCFVFGHKITENVAWKHENSAFGHKIAKNVDLKYKKWCFGHKSGRNVAEECEQKRFGHKITENVAENVSRNMIYGKD